MTDECPHPQDMLVVGLAGVAICADCWGAPKAAPTLPSVPLDDATARELARAGKHAQTWTERRNDLIREAVANGGGVREVARAVGLNHATVLNIIKPKQRKP